MPSLDIAASKSCFQNHIGSSRVQPLFLERTKDICAFGKEKQSCSAWKMFQTPRKVNFCSWRVELHTPLVVKAVATFETKLVAHRKEETSQGYDLQLCSNSNLPVVQLSTEDSNKFDERERLRRMRISKANKGNVPWNKGRKHSAETLRRIRERTKLAMQDPKVKMKLANLGHAQSEETRTKIGVAVRMGWQRRRERLLVQETCYIEWQNLVAEASRKGYLGEDELQWNSYKLLDMQLKQEWLESVKERKSIPRPKGSKRAPKSLEQRRKISEAISAKWADPEYRQRVCSALAKYHGKTEVAERKPRRNPRSSSSVRSRATQRATDFNNSSGTEGKKFGKPSRPNRNAAPSYKDPLASTKLEMIRKIREERTAMETKKRAATEKAKLLIAEAEKAADALEVVALTSPLARASLLETRKLIAEATRSLEGIGSGQLTSSDSRKPSSSPFESNGLGKHFYANPERASTDLITDKKEVNGIDHFSLSETDLVNFNLDNFAHRNQLNGREPTGMTQNVESISKLGTPNNASPWSQSNKENTPSQMTYYEADRTAKDDAVPTKEDKPGAPLVGNPKSSTATTKKKWVCGRLVEVERD